MPPSTPSLFPNTPNPTGAITAHCDGGARGNPGPAGFGVQVTDENGNVLAELSEFLGFRTNNYAEYSGLLASLQYALDHNHRSLKVISDSELMVKQIQGRYKVNSPDLKPLWQEAKNRIAQLGRFEIAHALRHKNKDADRLANEAMDRGMKRGTPAESAPIVSNADPRLTNKSGVQSLPLRAVPYPDKSTAPPVPQNLDPAAKIAPRQKLSSPPEQSQELSSRPEQNQKPSSRPERSGVEGPASSPHPPNTAPSSTMLRGFARDGVIHLLGSHTLPNGTFVKIIPE